MIHIYAYLGLSFYRKYKCNSPLYHEIVFCGTAVINKCGARWHLFIARRFNWFSGKMKQIKMRFLCFAKLKFRAFNCHREVEAERDKTLFKLERDFPLSPCSQPTQRPLISSFRKGTSLLTTNIHRGESS